MSGNIDKSYKKQSFDSDIKQRSASFSQQQYTKLDDADRKTDKSVLNLTYPCTVKPNLKISTTNMTKYGSLSESSSDTSDADRYLLASQKAKAKRKKLPPIGVFWDIENCQVPKGRSAVSVAQLIRDQFFNGFREAEFIVVCDVKKEHSQIIQELNDAQVTLVHVSSTCKNAADEKLRQALRRFADTYSAPAAVILISGDINFAADLSDLRHRKKLHVILIHQENTADALILCASEHYNYTSITQPLPIKEKVPAGLVAMEVIVRNLPQSYDHAKLKNRLKQLSDNCGGRVVYVCLETGNAVVRFSTLDIAVRAQRRMDGEDVYGNKISVSYPSAMRNWEKSYSPYKIPARRITKNPEMLMHPSSYGMPTMSLPYPSMDYYNSQYPNSSGMHRNYSEMHQEHGQYSNAEQYNFKNEMRMNQNGHSNSRNSEGPRGIRGANIGPMHAEYGPSGDQWRSHSASFSEGQKRSQTPNESTNSKQNWSRHLSGSYNSLNTMETSESEEVPGNRMPLFKFRELFETRYRNSISVSELYKLRDVCSISDELDGRMIALCPDLRTTTSPHLSSHSGLESPHCLLHCPNGLGERGWAEPEVPPLPNVRFKLKLFTSKVHELLHSHLGSLPLQSFPVCYEMENDEKMSIDDAGVPLEHLITCVVGVELRLSSNMVKYLVWDNQVNGDDCNNEEINSASSVCGAAVNTAMNCVSPPLATHMALFSRELVDLLRTAPHCQLPFNRFIPTYHHHFGRQCRVADYGYTKLVDLFDSLSNIVQIIGEGNKRIITLSHSAQIRRFTSDLWKVLKSQASKQVTVSEFAVAYERVLSRPFDPVDYGLCELSDLLEEVSENTVVIKQCGDDIVIAIPKREQTNQEILNTKQFAVEVVDLLRHAPQYGMLFNKFVPSYHHHFGHQCRVSDYGFTKLMELFEAIPEVVKIEETSDGERRVSLTAKEALSVVRQQITCLVKSSRLQSIPLISLPATFLREHGYPLRPDLYECSTIEELLSVLSDSLQLVTSLAGHMVITVAEETHQQLGIRIWSLLLKPPHSFPLSTLQHNFTSKFGFPCISQQMEKYRTILEIKNNANGDSDVCLTPRYCLAARLYHLLFDNGGTLLLGNVDGMYLRKYGKVLRPAEYGATTLNALLSQLPFIFIIRGRRNKKNVALNTSLAALGIPLPTKMKYHWTENGLNGGANNITWPPPPAHTYLFNSGRTTTSPPKPDTPPTHTHSHWESSVWSPSPNFATALNLCIPMPFMQTPPLMENENNLTSPMKNLLAAYPTEENSIKAPDPSELPMPNAEFLNKGKVTSPSKDSGISSTSFTNSIEEPDSSTNFEQSGSTTPKKKRHLKLAAQFSTPLNLS